MPFDLDDLAGGKIRVSERARLDELHRYPIIGTTGLFQLKSGRTSAPRLPHDEQVKRGLMSDRRTSSRHASPLIATEWLQWWSAQ
jgi:hypothetical protein